MLSRENRFSLKTDRFRIETTGQTRYTPIFTLISAPRQDISSKSRFALLVSKRSFPLSVDRHQIKRRISEILRLNLSKYISGKDFILIPKKTIEKHSDSEVQEDLLKALSNNESHP